MSKRKYVNLAFFFLVVFITACGNPIIEEIWGIKTIIFDSNGGSSVLSQNLFKGKPVMRPGDPGKTNFVFYGWYQDNDAFFHEWDFDAIPVSDLVLYAKWLATEITLAEVTVTAPRTYELPDKTAIGQENFLTGNAVWTPSNVPFLGGIVYEVSVTLTARDKHFFAANAAATINGYVAKIDVSPNGLTAIVTYEFPQTGPAQIELTIEQITEGAPLPNDNITLSRTGAGNPITETISIANTLVFSNIRWEIVCADQTITGTGASFTLNAADTRYNVLGGNTLRLFVTRAGIPYQTNINFTIVE